MRVAAFDFKVWNRRNILSRPQLRATFGKHTINMELSLAGLLSVLALTPITCYFACIPKA